MTRAIAVVDDEPMVREFITHVLTRAGYPCREFENGHDFLVNHGTATRGVILGIVMPVMGGFETMRQMQRLRMGIPVIAMSGSRNMTADDLARFGAKAFLPKPFRTQELLEAVRRFVV